MTDRPLSVEVTDDLRPSSQGKGHLRPDNYPDARTWKAHIEVFRDEWDRSGGAVSFATSAIVPWYSAEVP